MKQGKEQVCANCGHKKKSHYWRPYGSNKKALGCHIKFCTCKSYKEKNDN